MATLPIGTAVELSSKARAALRTPPRRGAELHVAVHSDALAARGSTHTQLVVIEGAAITWAAAMGEELLEVRKAAPAPMARSLLASAIGKGPRLWEFVRPGELLTAEWTRTKTPLSTIYLGKRPWLVIGATESDRLLAAPLNKASNPKWYSPVLPQSEMEFEGNDQDSQVELAHLWTMLPIFGRVGRLTTQGVARLEPLVREHFGC